MDIPTKKRRRTPTERQMESIEVLDLEVLIARALESLHALNRRAKEMRDRAHRYRRSRFTSTLENQIHEIYSLKNRFLTALVRTDRARVFAFRETRVTRPEWSCSTCDRWWGGDDDSCHRCGESGERLDAGSYERTWYVVQSGNYRFHQPEDCASAEMAAHAIEIAPHDPVQPRRVIPEVGLTIEAQHRTVALAIARLEPNPPEIEWPCITEKPPLLRNEGAEELARATQGAKVGEVWLWWTR